MSHQLFYLFSIIEFTAVLTLTLSIFLFNVKGLRSHILFSAFILAQASYLTRVGADLESISIIIQLATMILILRFIFRVQIFYAALMGIIGYIIIGLLQMSIMIVFSLVTPFTFEQIANNDPGYIGYLIQLISSAVNFLLSFQLLKRRFGFSFVPDNDSERINLKGNNILLLGAMLIGIIVVSVYSYFFFDTMTAFALLTIIMVFITCILFWLALKKERQHD